jgi:hypothetical protein
MLHARVAPAVGEWVCVLVGVVAFLMEDALLLFEEIKSQKRERKIYLSITLLFSRCVWLMALVFLYETGALGDCLCV